MGKRLHRDIVIRGVTYPTIADAAVELGVSASTIRHALLRGTLDRVGLGRRGFDPMPVNVRGTDYPSARHAANALGLTPEAIYRAIAQGRTDTVGSGGRCPNPAKARPVRLGPVTFPSMQAASVALGFSRGYIANARFFRRASAQERILAAAMAYAARRAGAGYGGAHA